MPSVLLLICRFSFVLYSAGSGVNIGATYGGDMSIPPPTNLDIVTIFFFMSIVYSSIFLLTWVIIIRIVFYIYCLPKIQLKYAYF